MFTLNTLKCTFFQQQVSYLGHILKDGHISNFPIPTDTHSLQRFIDMTQFCSKFIPNLNVTLASLFAWNNMCHQAFNCAKELLITPPVLRSPSPQDHLIIEWMSGNWVLALPSRDVIFTDTNSS